MINCRNCVNWVDRSFEQIASDQGEDARVFMGCRIYGFVENNTALAECKHYEASENAFTICNHCHISVPKVCVSLGECVNCTDTDLFCIDHCIGGDSRKYCTHFVRLRSEGITLIDNDQLFDLYPSIDMPDKKTDR